MTKVHHLLTAGVLAGALALPGVALAQGNGNNAPEGPMPSQRLVNTQAAGQGAVLTIAGSGVREVQQALNRLGYSAGPITGNWDGRTQHAMAQFQAAHGLAPNGNLDISSIAALGLWNNLIGNPNGNGNRPLVAMNTNGSPPPRGNGGSFANGAFGNGGGGGGGYAMNNGRGAVGGMGIGNNGGGGNSGAGGGVGSNANGSSPTR